MHILMKAQLHALVENGEQSPLIQLDLLSVAKFSCRSLASLMDKTMYAFTYVYFAIPE